MSLLKANAVKIIQGSASLNKCQIQFKRNKIRAINSFLLIHHELKWDRISQRLTHFSRLLLLSPLPAIMNTNVFQSGSYFLTTHSGALKFRLPHHCHIPKAVSAAACEGALLSLAHGGKLGGAKKKNAADDIQSEDFP